MSKEFERKVLEFIDISKENFDRIDNKIDNLEDKMNNKIDDLENRMNNKIDDLENRMNNKIDDLENRMNSSMNDLENRISNTLVSLNKSVTLIEDKVMSEFPALFEAFELHQEMHKDYDEKNSYLSLKVEENSMKISILEDQMKFIKSN